jgi:hypothetical protein
MIGMIERLLRRLYRSRDVWFATGGAFMALVAAAFLIPSGPSPLHAVAIWYFDIGLVGLVALTCIEFAARCVRLILHVKNGTFRRCVWNVPSPPIWDPPLSLACGFVVGAVLLAATPFLTLLYAGALLARLVRYALATLAHAGAMLRVVTAPLVWQNPTVDAADLYQAVEQSATYLRRVARILPPEVREVHAVAMVDNLHALVRSERCATPRDVHLVARRIALEAADVSIREQLNLSDHFASPARTLRLLAMALAGAIATATAALDAIASVVSIATAHLPPYALALCTLAVILAAIIGGVAAVWRQATPESASGRTTLERG